MVPMSVLGQERRDMRACAIVLMLLLFALRSGSAQEPLALVKAIDLPRVEGRIDHLAFDPSTQKLLVAALGNNTVEVVDVKSGAHVKSLQGFREPQGIAVATGASLAAIANGQGDGIQLIATSDYRTVKAVSLGDDADNVRYDAVAKLLYVGYGNGALAAIDPADGRVTGQVKLAGHPESFQLEHSGSRIFVNVPNAGHIAVIDRNGMKIVATWPVVTAKSNFPMALDEANHRLFIGCRRPARLLVYDTTTGKQIVSSDIVGDTDDLFYDADRKRLYVSGGEGFIDVLDTQTPTPTKLARVASADGARTSLFVAEQHRLYLAVPHRGAQNAQIRVYEAR